MISKSGDITSAFLTLYKILCIIGWIGSKCGKIIGSVKSGMKTRSETLLIKVEGQRYGKTQKEPKTAKPRERDDDPLFVVFGE